MTTNYFAAQKIVNLGFERWSFFIDSAAVHGLLEDILADNCGDGVFNAYKIIGTRLGMHVASALLARDFVERVSAGIALISDNIVYSILSEMPAVAGSIAFSRECAADILGAMTRYI